MSVKNSMGPSYFWDGLGFYRLKILSTHGMSARGLIRAIRCQDTDAVRQLLAHDELDVNAEVQVEGFNFLPQETPTYPSTALLEACRAGNHEIALLVLQHPAADVNQRTTALYATAFADACFRNDVDCVRFLLQDARIDASIGDSIVAHPALYPCLTGNMEVLKLLAESGLLTDELEGALLETSAANGHHECIEFIENHYIDVRSMEALPASKQPRKVERVCTANGGTLDGKFPAASLRSIVMALGAQLLDKEFEELRNALQPGSEISPDGLQLFRTADLTSFWLSA